jgi:aspartyl-tRNA synthetase
MTPGLESTKSPTKTAKTVKRTVRTHHCGELRATDLGNEVQLCGWVAKRRDHGGLIFADLRDRHGLTQITFDPGIAESKNAHEIAGKLRGEFVVWAKGKVRKRPEGMTNTKLATGEIEVIVHDLVILSEAKTPPFAIEDDIDTSENLRLKYRYLDLRRGVLQKNLVTRHKKPSSQSWKG